jgi:hypothetical protein
MPVDFKMSGPGPKRGGGGYVNTEHVGHLLAYGYPTEEERTYDGKKSTVAACSFVVCANCHKAWSDCAVSGASIAPALLSATGETVVIRLILGEAEGDRNPPVLPEDPLPVELEDMQKVFDGYALRMPSGTIVFDVVKYNADHKTPPAS